MARIIINYESSMPEARVLDAVKKVVEGGRVSKDGTCFCYVVKFASGVVVASERTRTGSDVFHVYREEPSNGKELP